MNKINSVLSLSCFASIAGLLFGYDTGIISGAILFIQPALHLDHSKIELVVSSVLIGAIMGSLFSSTFADQISRRSLVCVTSFKFMIGSLICAFASSLTFLVLGRFLLGFAIGISAYVVPMYIAEISPARYRGALVAFNTIAVTFGMLLAYVANYLLSPYHAWRIMLGLGFFPAFFLSIGIYLLPESPRWLIQQGKIKLGKDILRKLRKHTSVEKECTLIQTSPLNTQTKWRDLWLPKYRMALLIGIVLAMLQQFSGINSILYYTPIYLTNYHLLSTQYSLLITIGNGLTNLLMTIVAMFLVDRIGRRQLLLWGLTNIICFLFLLIYALPLANASHPWTIWLVLIGLFGFIAAYAVSIGCIFWIIIAEIYPLSIRNVAMGFASSCNWISNFIVSASFLTTVDNIGIRATLLGYSFFMAAGWIFCYLYLPETARFMLEESSDLIKEGILPENTSSF